VENQGANFADGLQTPCTVITKATFLPSVILDNKIPHAPISMGLAVEVTSRKRLEHFHFPSPTAPPLQLFPRLACITL
jgi:hypothetical protein